MYFVIFEKYPWYFFVTKKKEGVPQAIFEKYHDTRVWRKKFSKSIHNLNRGNLRKATMLLTGHVTLNYHLNKYKPDKISKTCPHCLAAEETTNHYIGQCPKWSAQRSAVFNSFYLSISLVVDDYSIFAITKYINATGRLNPITEWQD